MNKTGVAFVAAAALSITALASAVELDEPVSTTRVDSTKAGLGPVVRPTLPSWATVEPRSTPVTPKPSASRKAASEATQSPKPVQPVKAAEPKVKPSKAAPKRDKVSTIGGYVNCSGYAQKCIDQGKLTQYDPGRPTLAGHNYMGHAWMADLPVGRTVKITSGALAGTYKVYGHAWSERARKGGKFPGSAMGAAVVLQTCLPDGTSFTLLRRA